MSKGAKEVIDLDKSKEDKESTMRKNNRKSLYVLLKGEVRKYPPDESLKIIKEDEPTRKLFLQPSKVFSFGHQRSAAKHISRPRTSINGSAQNHRRGTSAGCKQGSGHYYKPSQKIRQVLKNTRTNSTGQFSTRNKRSFYKQNRATEKLAVICGQKLMIQRTNGEDLGKNNGKSHHEQLQSLLNEPGQVAESLLTQKSSLPTRPNFQSKRSTRPMTTSFTESGLRATGLETNPSKLTLKDSFLVSNQGTKLTTGLGNITDGMTPSRYISKRNLLDMSILESYSNFEHVNKDQDKAELKEYNRIRDKLLANEVTEESYNFIDNKRVLNKLKREFFKSQFSSTPKCNLMAAKDSRMRSADKLVNRDIVISITEDIEQFCPKYDLGSDPMIIQSLKINSENKTKTPKAPQKLKCFLNKLSKRLKRSPSSCKSAINLRQQKSSNRLAKPRIHCKSILPKKREIRDTPYVTTKGLKGKSTASPPQNLLTHCKGRVRNIFINPKYNGVHKQYGLKKKISISLLKDFDFK
ncbi:unnamed protein product [Moneuplotes crassus]|uniref:Uncharacterized protein n=1 Tax=Euplotes crassus TaxID=5936 RepID=A0AAD1U3D2_EUPCR|nr:unnamed protein product [Moneuplotes crassus]